MAMNWFRQVVSDHFSTLKKYVHVQSIFMTGTTCFMGIDLLTSLMNLFQFILVSRR